MCWFLQHLLKQVIDTGSKKSEHELNNIHIEKGLVS